MQQLTLNFEGFADSRQPVDVKAPARKVVQVMNLVQNRTKAVAVRLTARARQTVSPWAADWQQWAAQRSQTFTALCSTDEGEVFTRGDVVKAYLALALVLILIGVGGAL